MSFFFDIFIDFKERGLRPTFSSRHSSKIPSRRMAQAYLGHASEIIPLSIANQHHAVEA